MLCEIYIAMLYHLAVSPRHAGSKTIWLRILALSVDHGLAYILLNQARKL